MKRPYETQPVPICIVVIYFSLGDSVQKGASGRVPKSKIPMPRNEEVERIELARRLQVAEETLTKAKSTFGEKVEKLKKRHGSLS